MDLNVVLKPGAEGKQLHLNRNDEAKLREKLTKLEARFSRPLSARVTLSEAVTGFEALVTVQASGPELVGKGNSKALGTAIQLAVSKIDRQLEQRTDKMTGKERNRRSKLPAKEATL